MMAISSVVNGFILDLAFSLGGCENENVLLKICFYRCPVPFLFLEYQEKRCFV